MWSLKKTGGYPIWRILIWLLWLLKQISTVTHIMLKTFKDDYHILQNFIPEDDTVQNGNRSNM